ncbi:MAG: 16S rRNA (guanine(527)-N(7))-methyltransferase RsmG [Thermoleophilaceae bacterium]
MEAEPLCDLLSALAAEPDPPTTVSDPVDEHVADSLSALPYLGSPARLADIGSGVGFPGLALAVALPSSHVALIESQRRHAAVAERLGRGAGLRNVSVLALRVEDAPDRGCFDVVTVRAVAPLAVLVEYAAPLLVSGGQLVAWKGARDEAEELGGEEAGRVVGLSLDRVVAVEPFPGAHSRHLHFYVKTAPTPDRFPRRPGMARKRPLA